jgi:hypothetical protein
MRSRLSLSGARAQDENKGIASTSVGGSHALTRREGYDKWGGINNGSKKETNLVI